MKRRTNSGLRDALAARLTELRPAFAHYSVRDADEGPDGFWPTHLAALDEALRALEADEPAGVRRATLAYALSALDDPRRKHLPSGHDGDLWIVEPSGSYHPAVD